MGLANLLKREKVDIEALKSEEDIDGLIELLKHKNRKIAINAANALQDMTKS